METQAKKSISLFNFPFLSFSYFLNSVLMVAMETGKIITRDVLMKMI